MGTFASGTLHFSDRIFPQRVDTFLTLFYISVQLYLPFNHAEFYQCTTLTYYFKFLTKIRRQRFQQ